jgi:hypothetical protein
VWVTLGLAVDLAYFLNMTWDLCIILAMFFHTNDMEVMRLPNGQGFSSFLTHDMGKLRKNLGTFRKNICKRLQTFFLPRQRRFELFSRVGWEGFGKAQNGAWGGGWAANALPRMGWEWFRMV